MNLELLNGEHLTRFVFPSPTGVNYYEYLLNKYNIDYDKGFRPQQGLTIMNKEMCKIAKNIGDKRVSVPNRG